MVSQAEAQRIAASVNILRPDWRVGLIMAVLGDEKCIRRPFRDLALAMTAVAVDPPSQKPGRIHEPGPWWNFGTSPVAVPRYTADDDCGICSGPANSTHDGHAYQPRLPPGEWARPTPEQRELMRIAAEQAHLAKTAAAVDEP